MNLKSRWWLLIPAILLILVVFYYFSAIVGYLVVSAILALMGRPILRLLGKVQIKGRKIPDALKAIFTLLALYGLFAMIFVLTLPSLVRQTRQLETVNVQSISEGLEEPIAAIERLAYRYNLVEGDMSVENYIAENVAKVLGSARISNIANAIIGFTGDLLIAIFSVSFITFFFLKERSLMSSIFMALIPSAYRERVGHVADRSKVLLTRYFIGVLTEVLLVGLLIAMGLGF
ncbi:MAG: AI-2E family transporter, partial [Bacteroidota bacterium]